LRAFEVDTGEKIEMSQLVDFTYSNGAQERDCLKPISGNRWRLLHWLISVQALLDRFSVFVLVGLLGFLTMWAFAASHAKLSWFDELLGLSIANSPTLGDLIPHFRDELFSMILRVLSFISIYAGLNAVKTLRWYTPVGEKQNQPFQLSFNASLKVDFQGSRVTSDGGLILVREMDERLLSPA
jgi:hypothetical protein